MIFSLSAFLSRGRFFYCLGDSVCRNKMRLLHKGESLCCFRDSALVTYGGMLPSDLTLSALRFILSAKSRQSCSQDCETVDFCNSLKMKKYWLVISGRNIVSLSTYLKCGSCMGLFATLFIHFKSVKKRRAYHYSHSYMREA